MVPKFTGKRLNRRQARVNKGLAGNAAGYYLQTVIDLIESDSLDWKDERIAALVGRLRELLERV